MVTSAWQEPGDAPRLSQVEEKDAGPMRPPFRSRSIVTASPGV